jgi:hypothetical protein
MDNIPGGCATIPTLEPPDVLGRLARPSDLRQRAIQGITVRVISTTVARLRATIVLSVIAGTLIEANL